MVKVRRVLSVLCLFAFLGLPLAAQTHRQPVSPVAGLLEAFWERLTAPLAPLSPVTALWQADEAVSEEPAPAPGTDSGGSWDPFG